MKEQKIFSLQRPSFKFQISNFKHFTLIEVLMVCALLAFLMAIMVGGYSIATTKMAEADCRATIEKIATALEAYKAKTGYYIQAQGDNAVFYMDDPNGPKPNFSSFIDYEKMMKTSLELYSGNNRYYLVDPYGTAFWYQCPGVHNRMKFDLESAGKDASFGYEPAGGSYKAHSTPEATTSDSDYDKHHDNLKNWE